MEDETSDGTTAGLLPIAIEVPVGQKEPLVWPQMSWLRPLTFFSAKHGPAVVGGVRDVSAGAVFDALLVTISVLNEYSPL